MENKQNNEKNYIEKYYERKKYKIIFKNITTAANKKTAKTRRELATFRLEIHHLKPSATNNNKKNH